MIVHEKTKIDVDNKTLVDKAKTVLERKGLNFDNSIKAFLMQIINDNNFPFDFKVNNPSDVSVECFMDDVDMARHPEKYKTYNSFSEAVEDIENE